MSKLPFPGLGSRMGEHTPLRAFLRRLPMYLILTAFALMYLEPVLYMISTSFKRARDLTDATAKWIPREPTMTSMNFAFDAMKVWPTFLPDRSLWENLMRSNLFVSIVTTFVPALVQVFTCAIAGYAFARLNFPCKRLLFVLLLLSYIIPPQTVFMPLTWVFRALGVINNPMSFILPAIFGAGLKGSLFIIIYMQFFKKLPAQLEEAAYIDGASTYKVFFKVMLPLAKLLEKIACLVGREKNPGAMAEPMRLKYFDERLLNTPPIAAAQLFKEVQRMGDIAMNNFTGAMACFENWDEARADEITRNEEVLDFLNKEITSCLVEVKGLDLDERDTRLVGSLFHVVNDMERVGDHSQNILEAAQLRHKEDIKFSEKAVKELDALSAMITAQLDRAMDIFSRQDTRAVALKQVEDVEQEIDDITEALREHHVDRLKQHKCSAKNGMIYLDILTNLERIGDHAENIASSVEKQQTAHHAV